MADNPNSGVKQEFRSIYAYIANILLVPDTAKKQLGRILNRIKQPNEMLSWFSLVENEPWHSRGVRKLIVDNYMVFYYPNEPKKSLFSMCSMVGEL